MSGFHSTDNAAMRYTLGSFGVLVACVLLLVSAKMNYRFGYSLGKTPEDGEIYAWASVAADVFKALVPFFFFAAWRSKAWAAALAAFAVWLVVTGYALTGALGHSLLNRMETAGKRTLAAETHKDLRAGLKKNQDDLNWLPSSRSTDAVKAEMESLRAKNMLLWTNSSECERPEGKGQRTFCGDYFKLKGELGNAESAAKFRAKIEDIEGKLADTKNDAVMEEADPQAGTLAKVTGTQVSTVQFALAIMIVALLEFGSGLGPYVALSYMFAFGRSKSDVIDADYKELHPGTVGQPHVQAQTDVLVAVPLIAQSQAKPLVNETPSVPAPATAQRARLSGTDGALKAIGIPFTGDRNDPLLDALPGREAAEALVAWIRAHDLARADLSSDQISAYDAECCKERHRKQTYERDLKNAMERLRGVEKRRPEQPDGSRPYRYDIKPGKYPKPAPPAAPAPEPEQPRPKPQEGGRLLAFGRRPLAVAPREGAHMGSRGAYPGNVHRNRRILLTSKRRAA